MTGNTKLIFGEQHFLNSAFAKSNMDVVWVNQDGTYTFQLPAGRMAIVMTYHGIYPHYRSGAGYTGIADDSDLRAPWADHRGNPAGRCADRDLLSER